MRMGTPGEAKDLQELKSTDRRIQMRGNDAMDFTRIHYDPPSFPTRDDEKISLLFTEIKVTAHPPAILAVDCLVASLRRAGSTPQSLLVASYQSYPGGEQLPCLYYSFC